MGFRAVRLGLILGLGLLVSACQMPRSGPNAAEILSGSVENGGTMHVVLVNDRVADASYVDDTLGFTRAFLNAGVASVSRINPGDLLNITIWENIENGLLVAAGTNSIVLPANPPARKSKCGARPAMGQPSAWLAQSGGRAFIRSKTPTAGLRACWRWPVVRNPTPV